LSGEQRNDAVDYLPAGAQSTRVAQLYTWVVGPTDRDGMPHHAGVLYIGIGTGADGWVGRIRREHGWVGPSAEHGHGMAMYRTKAIVIGGPVGYEPDPLAWLSGVDLPDKGRQIIKNYLATVGAQSPVAAAEKIAIRLAIHIGDTGAPVNSSGAGGWANDRAEDWAAYAVAKLLRPADPGEAPSVVLSDRLLSGQ
jgi:hypothetical protein